MIVFTINGIAMEQAKSYNDLPQSCVLHVCTSCRPTNFPREPKENRPGYKLYKELKRLIKVSDKLRPITLQPVQCMSLCKRPCGIALSSPGAWSYLFGDQDATATPHDILECVSVYLKAPRGKMSRLERPAALQASILGRIPPSGETR